MRRGQGEGEGQGQGQRAAAAGGSKSSRRGRAEGGGAGGGAGQRAAAPSGRGASGGARGGAGGGARGGADGGGADGGADGGGAGEAAGALVETVAALLTGRTPPAAVLFAVNNFPRRYHLLQHLLQPPAEGRPSHRLHQIASLLDNVGDQDMSDEEWQLLAAVPQWHATCQCSQTRRCLRRRLSRRKRRSAALPRQRVATQVRSRRHHHLNTTKASQIGSPLQPVQVRPPCLCLKGGI
jgi:hypothetical protein